MPLQVDHGPMSLIDLADVLPDLWRLAHKQEANDRREEAERSLNVPGEWGDDEEPVPERPAPQVTSEANRLHGDPDHWASGRTAR